MSITDASSLKRTRLGFVIALPSQLTNQAYNIFQTKHSATKLLLHTDFCQLNYHF